MFKSLRARITAVSILIAPLSLISRSAAEVAGLPGGAVLFSGRQRPFQRHLLEIIDQDFHAHAPASDAG
jgi:hypothetical protein